MFEKGLFNGQRILITGGGTGLGKAMAERFLGLGAELFICGRRLRVCEETAAELMAKHAKDCGRVLVVDEGRETGGIAEEIFTHLEEHAPGVKKQRVAGKDSYIPLAAAANLILLSEDEIHAAAKSLL